MAVSLRPARPDETDMLSALCLRSKAYWGYNAAFMDACRDELTVVLDDRLIVAERDGSPLGVAQIACEGDVADLLLLFVDPPAIGSGVGRQLFDWCVNAARAAGAKRLTIEADPGAEPFYLRMGVKRVGTAPSLSIPGRVLPLLEYPLR